MTEDGQQQLFESRLPVAESTRVAVCDLRVTHGLPPPADLVESVREHGVLHPIIALRSAGDVFDVWDGRRRVLAAREAGRPDVPALMYPAGCELPLAAISLALHETRSENPVAAYHALVKLRAETGQDDAGLARALGMNVSRVSRLLKLEQLGDELIAAFSRGTFGVGVAEQLLKLPQAARDELAARVRSGERINMADVTTLKRARAATLAGALSQATMDALFGMPVTVREPGMAELAGALTDETLERVVAELAADDALTHMRATFLHVLQRRAAVVAPHHEAATQKPS